MSAKTLGAKQQYGKQSDEELDFKTIALKQFNRITKIGSKEPHGGYWKEQPIQDSSGATHYTEKYVTDKREEYSTAVQTLYDILKPRAENKLEKAEELIQEYEITRKKHDKDEYEKNIEFTTYKRRIHRKIFQELCKFMEEKNWLGGTHVID